MRRAILDIGYNAIRTVVYDDENIGSPEILNIKFRNDMLNLLEGESLDIRHQTYLNINYFLHIFKNLRVEKINCVATEILRNHPRSGEFVDYIKTKFDLEIEVLSGQKEAELSAIGLMVGIPGASGISVDLGGGSLELVEVNENKLGNRQSFLLGTKLLKSKNIILEEQVIKEIKSKIWNNSYNNLYFVGGSLRFLARIYIDNNSYIKNLHNLEIPANEMLTFLNNIDKSCGNNVSLQNQIQSNKGAILIAKSLISVFNPLKIIISTYGLKEGVRADKNSFLKQDIIFEKTKCTCNYDESDTNFDDYIRVLKDLTVGEKDYSLLIKCAIMLLKIKHKFDKTIPPTALTQYILHSEIPYPHKFRLMLSLAVCYTTNFKPDNNLFYKSKEFLDKEERSTSQIIGDYLRVCEEIDGPLFSTPSFSIEKKGTFLEVQSEYLLPRVIFEKVCNRLKSISQARR